MRSPLSIAIHILPSACQLTLCCASAWWATDSLQSACQPQVELSRFPTRAPLRRFATRASPLPTARRSPLSSSIYQPSSRPADTANHYHFCIHVFSVVFTTFQFSPCCIAPRVLFRLLARYDYSTSSAKPLRPPHRPRRMAPLTPTRTSSFSCLRRTFAWRRLPTSVIGNFSGLSTCSFSFLSTAATQD